MLPPAKVLAEADVRLMVPVPVKTVGTTEAEYVKPPLNVTVLDPIARVLDKFVCARAIEDMLKLKPFVPKTPKLCSTLLEEAKASWVVTEPVGLLTARRCVNVTPALVIV